MSTRGIPNRAMGTGIIARDNTLINAHQGEKLLTKQEAKVVGSGGSKKYTINFYDSHFESEADVDGIVSKMVKRLEDVENNVT